MVQFTTATTWSLASPRRKASGARTRNCSRWRAKAADRRRTRLPAAGARRGASVLPVGQPPLRNRRHADHVEPQRCPMGHRVGRSGCRHCDPRLAPAPQPRADHPRRQLPAPRQAKERPHQAVRRSKRSYGLSCAQKLHSRRFKVHNKGPDMRRVLWETGGPTPALECVVSNDRASESSSKKCASRGNEAEFRRQMAAHQRASAQRTGIIKN